MVQATHQDDSSDEESYSNEEPPKPISSAEEDSDDMNNEDDSATLSADEKTNKAKAKDPGKQKIASASSSRLLSPYRSVGVIIETGATFTLTPNQNSAQGFVTCSIGNRFHMLRTERLQPVFVSQTIVGKIRTVIPDASSSTTLAVHGTTHVTLFNRTKPVQTIRLAKDDSYYLQTLLSMGHIQRKSSSDGRLLNHAVSVAILRKVADGEDEDDSSIPIVGDHGDSDSEQEQDEVVVVDHPEGEVIGDETNAKGAVVVLVSSRDGITMQRRIYLESVDPLASLHPATYLNKILVGGVGSLCLLNIRSGKVLHEFTCLPDEITITSMEQAPAVDTVAIGTSTGKVQLVNLKFDKLLFSLSHPNVPVTSLSFRTDASALHYRISPLAVGLESGKIIVWDLNQDEETGERTVLCEMKHANATQMMYYPQEPLMVVAGQNSIQMYIFDQPDHSPRLLRQRSGHTKPPALIRYRKYGRVVTSMDGTDASCCQIVSCGGLDRTVRMFSTARSVLDREFSQGAGLNKKAKHWNIDRSELLLPPATGVAVSDDIREWGNMVTIHDQHPFAYVWSTLRHAQSGPILRQPHWKVSSRQKPPPTSTHATSLALSACGNFALVGTRGGIIYKYNIQSGLPRGSFPQDEKDKKKGSNAIGSVQRTGKELEKGLKTHGRSSNLDKRNKSQEGESKKRKALKQRLAAASHQGHAVTGLCVNAMNKTLMSIGMDGKLILWSMENHSPHRKSPLTFSCGITKLCYFRDSDLAALAMKDCSLLIFDCSALIVVRRLGRVHEQEITDLAFSPDGRTLYSSSFDGTMRAWDIPTNTCVDWIAFKSPPTSIAVSPTGEFVATSHVGHLGINVWSDKTYYQTVDSGVRPLTEPFHIDEPEPLADRSDEPEAAIVVSLANSMKTRVEGEGPADKRGDEGKGPAVPKEEGIVTLSGLPVSHWKNLFYLELVKERNKPKEPPKKPPSAPFFLQWRSNSILATDDTETKGVEQDKNDWEAVWSDDEADANGDDQKAVAPDIANNDTTQVTKRRKIFHHRSHTASLLKDCYASGPNDDFRFKAVTDYLAGLGPSAIDVELSSLCNGMHDLEDGLWFLFLGAQWLKETCDSKCSFESVNAYLNRFLYLHGEVILGLEGRFSDIGDDGNSEDIEEKKSKLLDAIGALRIAQKNASDHLRAKVEHSLCLVRHFSRIV